MVNLAAQRLPHAALRVLNRFLRILIPPVFRTKHLSTSHSIVVPRGGQKVDDTLTLDYHGPRQQRALAVFLHLEELPKFVEILMILINV